MVGPEKLKTFLELNTNTNPNFRLFSKEVT